jgi:hypothetical protein
MAYQVVGDFSTYIEARRRGDLPTEVPAHPGWRPYVLQGGTMATTEKPSAYEAKSESKPESQPSKGSLGPAGEASDPAVHDALARLEIARSNRAALDVDAADVKAADDAVKDAEKALAGLGYKA